jgi:hypothetical protein
MPNIRLRLLIAVAAIILTSSCGYINRTAGAGENSESLADIKKKLWRNAPRDAARDLSKVRVLEIKDGVSIERPASFVVSADNSIYIDDNAHGKVFKVSPDMRSTSDLGVSGLINPVRIREFNDKLFIYDNSGINIFEKNGQLVRTIKPFLKIEDFDLLDEENSVISLAALKPDDTSVYALLNSAGKRTDSIGQIRPSQYPEVENKSYLEARDGKLYTCYKYEPVCEIYDLKTKALLKTFSLRSSVFPQLIELKKDRKFVNPEPGVYKVSKFVGALKIAENKLYVLLHTPNPEIAEFTLDGEEVQRYRSNETMAIDFFGLDVRVNNGTKQFFVGAYDYSSNPSIAVFEAK